MKKLSKILLAISFVLSLTTSAFATTVTANADELIESAKDRTSNNLLSFFIIPPFKRFLKANYSNIWVRSQQRISLKYA